MIKIGFLVAGFKGSNFLKEIHRDYNVAFVSSYNVKDTLDNSFKEIKSLCSENSYRFIKHNDLNAVYLLDASLIFVVGWQCVIDGNCSKFIILHDSLLPKLIGFCPTVTALINGQKFLGITAFKPSKYIDKGPIYEQKRIPIKYPITIKDAYLLISRNYAQVARAILRKIKNKSLKAITQNNSLATYSIWRDKWDYFIDWNWTAEKIARFVDAVSWPYLGARTIYQGKEIIVDKVEVVADLLFENRQPGKSWSLNNGIPTVICGEGMIRIIAARDKQENKIVFRRLRQRFGSLKTLY
jgi:methionyl-tRNA formyltransferase